MTKRFIIVYHYIGVLINIVADFKKHESLILAQNERWRRASGMQVERESSFGDEYSGARVSNT